MVHKILLSMLAALVAAAPILESSPDTSEGILRVPISNKHPFDLSTIHVMDMARWAPLTNLEPSGFSAQATVVAPATSEFRAYIMTCSIGTPPQPLELAFDTGSSLVLTHPPAYQVEQSNTAQNLSQPFLINYEGGNANGTYYTDKMTINGVTFDQDFGIATHSRGLSARYDGTIG